MADISEADRVARDVAETVLAAYAQQANSSIHPAIEQTLLARLAEAIGPLTGGSAEGVIVAANAALDDFERAVPELRGPRISSLDMADRSVTARRA